QGRPADSRERASPRDPVNFCKFRSACLRAGRCALHVFGVAFAGGVAGRLSTALPVNRTGPVGTPLGEPPAGSSDTAYVAPRNVSTLVLAGSARCVNSSLPTIPSERGLGNCFEINHSS